MKSQEKTSGIRTLPRAAYSLLAGVSLVMMAQSSYSGQHQETVSQTVSLSNNCLPTTDNLNQVTTNSQETSNNSVNNPQSSSQISNNLSGLVINIGTSVPKIESSSSTPNLKSINNSSQNYSPVLLNSGFEINAPIVLSSNPNTVPTNSIDSSQSTNPNTINSSQPELNPNQCVVDPSAYNGDIWTKNELDTVQSLQPIFESVATQYNMPWQLLAAIKIRETGATIYDPTNGGGLFQINGANYPASDNLNDEQIFQQCQNVASFINNVAMKKVGLNQPLLNNNSFNLLNIAQVLFAYNGMSNAYIQQAINQGYSDPSQYFMGSPYVVNGIASWANYDINPNWQQIVNNNGSLEPATSQPGALLYFWDLFRLSDNGYTVNTAGMPDITIP